MKYKVVRGDNKFCKLLIWKKILLSIPLVVSHRDRNEGNVRRTLKGKIDAEYRASNEEQWGGCELHVQGLKIQFRYS